MTGKFTYKRAPSIQEAVEAASRPGARILAGGTDLLGCLRDQVFNAETVVSVSGIRELKGIGPRTGGGLRIGALTTLTEIAENRQVRESYQVLAEAAAAVASPQLRNQGTLGGNLCQRPRRWHFRGISIACARAETPVLPKRARTSTTPFWGGTAALSSILRIPPRR